MIVDRNIKTIQWRKDNLFNDGAGTSGYSLVKRLKLYPYLKSYTESNLRWIKDLYVSAKTINILERNISIIFCDLRLSSGLLNITPKTQTTEKIR